MAGVPAFGHGRAQHIAPRRKKRADVECLVAQAVPVARPARRKNEVADPAAVDLGLVDAVGGDVQPRPVDLAADLETPPEQDRRPIEAVALVPVGADQHGRPVGLRQEPRLYEGRFAPGRWRLNALAPDADPDAPALAGVQGGRLPGHQDGVRRLDAPTRPGRAAVALGRDFDLVARLTPAVRARGAGPGAVHGDLPGDPRPRLPDPERLAMMLERDADDPDSHGRILAGPREAVAYLSANEDGRPLRRRTIALQGDRPSSTRSHVVEALA